MLDLAREIRSLLFSVGAVEVLGMPIDWLLHLVGGALIVLIGARFFDLGRVVRLGASLLMAKELFDVLAKTRAEYIRPPTLDVAVDLAAGLGGIAVGYCLVKTRGARRRPAAASPETQSPETQSPEAQSPQTRSPRTPRSGS